MNTDHFILVSEKDLEQRLDKLLKEHFPTHSRTYFQYLIENGCVLVNGEKFKKREKPKLGDEIEICFILTPEISLEAEPIPLDLLYEDEHFLAINKPAGMVVHPAPGHPNHTFVNALLYHCKAIKKTSLRPGIVHRLDKDTTGVLLAAKTKEAHQELISLFSKRQIKKEYLAVCVGNPGEGLIEAPIHRHKTQRQKMTVCQEKGKEAMSRCTILATSSSYCLVKIELITGRTHQARVHMQLRKAPILGDPLYGSAVANKKTGIGRQLLHAHTIELCHPISKMPLKITAPIPQDMRETMDAHFPSHLLKFPDSP